MSKDIVIQEGGFGKYFTGVERLRTAKTGGGYAYWVPEDEVSKGGITGRGLDGRMYTVTTDDQENLVETLAPVKIMLTRYPYKLVYNDGEIIDYTNMVVRAYDSDDERWTAGGFEEGIIPGDQLILPVTRADAEDVTAGMKIDDPAFDGQTYEGIVVGALLNPGEYWDNQSEEGIILRYGIEILNCPAYVTYADGYGYYFASSSQSMSVKRLYKRLDVTPPVISRVSYEINSYEHDEKLVYYAIGDNSLLPLRYMQDIIPRTTARIFPNMGVPWIMVYGDDNGKTGKYSGQEIPVQWVRPGDHKMLETRYYIDVNAPE